MNGTAGDLGLRNVTGVADQVAILTGYYASGDGGGGVFTWSGSSATDDGGTIVNPAGGTGAGWRRVYSGPVDIRWYGARGDAAVDRAAIQQAIDTSPAIYVPAGTFLISGSALVLKSNRRIVGDGPGSVIQKSGTAAFSLLYGDNITDVVVENLKLIGTNSGTPGGAPENGSGIFLRSSQRAVVRGCLIQKFGGTPNLGGGGIAFDNGSSDILIDGNHVSLGAGLVGSDIQLTPDCKKAVISNNRCVSNNSTGIYAPSGSVISNNIVTDKLRHGVTIYVGAAVTYENETIISGNNLARCDWAGVYVAGVNQTATSSGRVLVSGNMIVDCGRDGSAGGSGLMGGIRASGLDTPLVINGNMISRSGTVAWPAPGINTTAVRQLDITANLVDTSSAQGLLINQVSRLRANNNDIRNTTGDAIRVDGQSAAAPQSVQIASNHLQLPDVASNGIALVYWVGTASVQLSDNKVHGSGTTKGVGIYVNGPIVGTIQNNYLRSLKFGIAGTVAIGHTLNAPEVLISHNLLEQLQIGMGFDIYNGTNGFVLGNIFKNVTTKFTDEPGTPSGAIKEAQTLSPRRVFFDAAAPGGGTWSVGDTVLNTSAAAGGTPGWVYTATGWRAMANLA